MVGEDLAQFGRSLGVNDPLRDDVLGTRRAPGVEGYDLTEASHNDIVRPIRENRKPVSDVEVSAAEALTNIMGRETIYQRRMVTWNEMGASV